MISLRASGAGTAGKAVHLPRSGAWVSGISTAFEPRRLGANSGHWHAIGKATFGVSAVKPPPMTRIYRPTTGTESWREFLAQPDLHWATGYSARTAAHCWEGSSGLPLEIANILEPVIGPAEMLLAIPEHKVALPGGRRESQCDVFALVRGTSSVVALAVEAKVDEPFGPTSADWMKDASVGKCERLAFILDALGLPEPPGTVRYQLLHRTVAAVVEADRFMTNAASMIVQSFSPQRRWFEDYAAFLDLFGISAVVDRVDCIRLPSGKPLYLGWACGEQRFRKL